MRNGESSTPELSLSLERHFGREAISQSASVQCSLSSSAVLSQSFFQKKMKNSLDAVLKEMEQREHLVSTKNHATSFNMDDSLLDSIGPSSQVEVASCRNSIATQSLFSFSSMGNGEYEEDDDQRQSQVRGGVEWQEGFNDALITVCGC